MSVSWDVVGWLLVEICGVLIGRCLNKVGMLIECGFGVGGALDWEVVDLVWTLTTQCLDTG